MCGQPRVRETALAPVGARSTWPTPSEKTAVLSFQLCFLSFVPSLSWVNHRFPCQNFQTAEPFISLYRRNAWSTPSSPAPQCTIWRQLLPTRTISWVRDLRKTAKQNGFETPLYFQMRHDQMPRQARDKHIRTMALKHRRWVSQSSRCHQASCWRSSLRRMRSSSRLTCRAHLVRTKAV